MEPTVRELIISNQKDSSEVLDIALEVKCVLYNEREKIEDGDILGVWEELKNTSSDLKKTKEVLKDILIQLRDKDDRVHIKNEAQIQIPV